MADDAPHEPASERPSTQHTPANPADVPAPVVTAPDVTNSDDIVPVAPPATPSSRVRALSDQDRLQRLTAALRSALTAAQAEAYARHSDAITTGHMLVGLLETDDAIASRVLRAQGIPPETVRLTAARRPTREQPIHPPAPTPKDIGLTRELKCAITNAAYWSRTLHHDYIGTEHLLLGLLDVDGDARTLLRRLRVDPKRLQAYTLAATRGEPVPTAPKPRNPLARLASLFTCPRR